MLVGCWSRRNARIGGFPNRAGTNIVNKRFLYSLPIASITIGGKNSSLGIRHYKLRAPPRPVGEGLESQERVQRRKRWYYVFKHQGDILIKTELPEYPVC